MPVVSLKKHDLLESKAWFDMKRRTLRLSKDDLKPFVRWARASRVKKLRPDEEQVLSSLIVMGGQDSMPASHLGSVHMLRSLQYYGLIVHDGDGWWIDWFGIERCEVAVDLVRKVKDRMLEWDRERGMGHCEECASALVSADRWPFSPVCPLGCGLD